MRFLRNVWAHPFNRICIHIFQFVICISWMGKKELNKNKNWRTCGANIITENLIRLWVKKNPSLYGPNEFRSHGLPSSQKPDREDLSCTGVAPRRKTLKPELDALITRHELAGRHDVQHRLFTEPTLTYVNGTVNISNQKPQKGLESQAQETAST